MVIKMSYIILLLHIFSCSSQYKRPESFNQKMNRYQARLSSNIIPQLTVNTQKFQINSTKSRTPASIPTQETSPKLYAKSQDIKITHFSNKRLYFLSLMDQYRKFQSYLPKENKVSSVNSCPSLHGAFLEYKRLQPVLAPSPKQNLNINPTDALLALPLGHKPQSKTLKDIEQDQRNNKHLAKALHIHAEKIYSELIELCQYGSSNNYYAYENLMGHIKRHPKKFDHSLSGLQSLIKTAIFANKVILSTIEKQLSSRAPASIPKQSNPWLKKAMKKNHIDWIEKYLDTVK